MFGDLIRKCSVHLFIYQDQIALVVEKLIRVGVIQYLLPKVITKFQIAGFMFLIIRNDLSKLYIIPVLSVAI